MQYEKKMKSAKNETPPELVFKNAKIVNVFTESVEEADIAVEDGIILGIGHYRGDREIDLKGAFVAPGFIDGHVHIESSMLTPPMFAKTIMPKGTTTIIADPHEIANVCGKDGIGFMLEAAKHTPLEIFTMIPSSVPATTFETAGATIAPSDVEALKDAPGILGLGEVMNYPGVLAGEADIHEKIKIMRGRPVDGHAPGLSGLSLNAYISAGVRTDHECSTVEEMIERVGLGMYVHLREGSVTRNAGKLLAGVEKAFLDRLLFCTDDKHPEDIRKEGHINHNINLAIESGLSPIEAIKIATLNPAQCYKLDGIGAIAPGYQADFVVFERLEKIEPVAVYKKGVKVAENDRFLLEAKPFTDHAVLNTVRIDPDAVDFTLRLKKNTVRVIGLVKNNILSEDLRRSVSVKEKTYVNNNDDDIMKLAVIERHKRSGNVGLGLVEGFGFKNGALAMTIAHDSHNLIVAGDSDAAMRMAMEKIIDTGGGIALVHHQKLIGHLPLPIAGIMTDEDPEKVAKNLETMKADIRNMGLSAAISDPFIQLAFLSLAVIPKLKLTDKGLFDVDKFINVPIESEE